MLNKIIILTITIFLTACVGNPSKVGSDEDAKKALITKPINKNLAVLYIIRDDRFVNSAVAAGVAVDGINVVNIADNSYTRIDIKPGTYRFWSEFSDNQEHEIKHGEVNIIRFMGVYMSPDTVYGKEHLSSLLSDDFQIPRNAVISTAKTVQENNQAALEATPAYQQKMAKKKANEKKIASLKKNARCKMKSSTWVYTGNQCKNGFAHGKGTAYDNQGLKFVGTFKAGQRVKGEIHQNGKMIFSGDLSNNKPNGKAICMYEGEYEECRFFKGKRIDTLYKIRKENTEMKAEMKKMKQQQSVAQSGSKGLGDYAADALKREAADRAANFIFDNLF